MSVFSLIAYFGGYLLIVFSLFCLFASLKALSDFLEYTENGIYIIRNIIRYLILFIITSHLLIYVLDYNISLIYICVGIVTNVFYFMLSQNTFTIKITNFYLIGAVVCSVINNFNWLLVLRYYNYNNRIYNYSINQNEAFSFFIVFVWIVPLLLLVTVDVDIKSINIDSYTDGNNKFSVRQILKNLFNSNDNLNIDSSKTTANLPLL